MQTTPLRQWRFATIANPDQPGLIRYACYAHKSITPTKAIVLLNGRAEWIEKYSFIPDELGLDQETLWITMDHRGQGVSAGKRAFIDSYATYAADLQSVIAAAAGDLPYSIIAHSMGGLIALYATLTSVIAPASMVLCSPLLGIPNSPIPARISRPLSRALTQLGLGGLYSGSGTYSRNGFPGNTLTSSMTGYMRMVQSPYPLPAASMGWVDATFKACDLVFNKEYVQGLKAPTLVIGGSAERVVEAAALSRWVQCAQQNATPPVEYCLIPDGRHELLNEGPVVRAQTLSEIRRWLGSAAGLAVAT